MTLKKGGMAVLYNDNINNLHYIILCLYYDLTHFSAINYIILLGKMYIYRQKMNENTIFFKYFLNELKLKIRY